MRGRLIFAALALVNLGEARIIQDNFNADAMNADLWAPSATGLPDFVQSGGTVNAFMPAASSGSIYAAGWKLRTQLHGDYDVRIDFSLDQWPVGNGVRVGIHASGIATERLNNNAAGEMYLMDFGSWWNGFGTSDLRGTLRMVRTERNVAGFAWTNNAWVQIGYWGLASTEDTDFSFSIWSHDGYFSHNDVTVRFDNFWMQDNAVDEPNPAWCLGLGLLVLAQRRRRRSS